MDVMTLKINESEYKFNFGFKFMRKINPLHRQPVEGMNETEDIGFQWEVMKWLGTGEYDSLITILDCANEGFEPRIKRSELEEYLEGMDCEEIEALDKKVHDFLSGVGLWKKKMEAVQKGLDAMNKESQSES